MVSYNRKIRRISYMPPLLLEGCSKRHRRCTGKASIRQRVSVFRRV